MFLSPTTLTTILYLTLANTIPFPPDNASGPSQTQPGSRTSPSAKMAPSPCTSLNRAAIYQVDPFAHTATTVHHFAPTDGILGIAEIENDVFVVVSANVSLSTSTAWPGSARMWRVDMVAWELVGEYTIPVFVNGLIEIAGRTRHRHAHRKPPGCYSAP